MRPDIELIKGRLSKITPTKWRYTMRPSGHAMSITVHDDVPKFGKLSFKGAICHMAHQRSAAEENADFICNAPDDIRALLAYIQELESPERLAQEMRDGDARVWWPNPRVTS